jgi:ribonuclease HII
MSRKGRGGRGKKVRPGCEARSCIGVKKCEGLKFGGEVGTPRDVVPLPPLAELRRLHVVEGKPVPQGVAAALEADPRKGARALLAAIAKKRAENRGEGQRLRKMLAFETALWSTGVEHVAGVDEAGMSPLAGPVSAAAVILRPGTRIPGVDDSKKLSPKERARLAVIIREEAVAYAVCFVHHDEIDSVNIYHAGLLAMTRAVRALAVPPSHLLVDARTLRDLDLPQQGIIKGDAKSLSIAAASILAKTTRDAHMEEMDARYPGYGFKQHKGYPVKAHYEALGRLGPCAIHRRSFPSVVSTLAAPSERAPSPTSQRARATAQQDLFAPRST